MNKLKMVSPVLLLLAATCFPSVVVAQDTTAMPRNTPEYLQIKQQLKAFRNDRSLYFGEGTAKIGNDLGKAKQMAKTRALADLSAKIEVRVESSMLKIVSSTSLNNKKQYSESINRNIIDKTKTYTHEVLRGCEITPAYIDYPDSGYVTIAAYLKKAVYKQRVENDLNTKKSVIRTTLFNGNNEYERHHYMQALYDWIEADNQLHEFFGDLPIRDKVGQNVETGDVNAYINGRITFFFSGLVLKGMNQKIRYDAKGRLNKQPMILAQYKDKNGQEQAVASLPLKTGFISGSGIAPSGLVTGTYGQVKLFISYVNPANKSTLLRVSVDTSRIKGMDNFLNLILPKLELRLYKVRTLALAVLFRNSGQITSPDELKNNIRSAIINQGLAAVQVNLKKTVLSSQDIQTISQTHADNLLFISIKTLNSSTVGGYQNMFVARCTATISVYELPSGNLTDTKQLPEVKGYGTSASSAGWDALNKLKNRILSETQNILGGIQ